MLATPATNVLAAGTAATAVHSILHTRADFFLEIAEVRCLQAGSRKVKGSCWLEGGESVHPPEHGVTRCRTPRKFSVPPSHPSIVYRS